MSLYFWHFNLGKRSVLWNLETDEGRRRAAELIDAADVVLVGEDSYRSTLGHMPDAFRSASVVCVSAYGLGHPDPDRSDDLHVQAQSGMVGLQGHGWGDEAEPILPAAEQSMHCAGLYAAIATLLALRVRTDDEGHLFDVSAQAAAFQSTEQLFGYWVYRREHMERRGGGWATSTPSESWLVPSADGRYVFAWGLLPLFGNPLQAWNDLRAWMRQEGCIEDLDDPIYDDVTMLHSLNPAGDQEAGKHARDVVRKFIESMEADRCYRDGQAINMGWAVSSCLTRR